MDSYIFRKRLMSTAAILYLLALADTFGGLVQGVFPASLLLRTIMIGFLLVYVFRLPSKRTGTQLLWFALIGYFLAKVMINYFIALDERVLSIEGGATLKLIYFPLLYAFLHDQLEKGRMTRAQLHSCILVYGWLILVSLMLGEVTGLGGVIGGRGAEVDAGKGFMIGANEVGLMLLLTSPFVGADMMRRTRSVVVGGLAQLLVYGVAGIYVFTKSSLVAAFVSAFSVYRSFVSRGKGARTLLWMSLLGLCVFLIMLIYDNIDAIEAFALGTFFSTLLDGNIVAFLFRGRQDYISAISPQLLDTPLSWLYLLFGSGEFYMREVSVTPLMLMPGEGTTFEMDFFDVFGAYGMVGSVLYVCVVGVLLRQAGPRKIPIEISVAIFCVMIHSFMAGHVLFSPQVTTLLALVLLYYRAPGRRAALIQ
jgi:hypothetical protein